MIRSVLLGALVLAGIQVLVSQPRAYNSVGGLSSAAGLLAERFLSPDVVAIPDRRASSPPSSAPTPPPPSSSRSATEGVPA